VVVQTDHINRVPNYSLTTVVPLSTKGSERIPSHAKVASSAINGLTSDSFAKCEQIQTVPQAHLRSHLGGLSAVEMARVDATLKKTLAL